MKQILTKMAQSLVHHSPRSSFLIMKMSTKLMQYPPLVMNMNSVIDIYRVFPE